MSIKLVVSDIDGTLIGHSDDHKYYISSSTVDRINQLKDEKIHFALATGRHYKDALNILKKEFITSLEPSFIVGMNGAQIYNIQDQKLIINEYIDEKHYKTIYKLYDAIIKDEPDNVIVMVYCEEASLKIVKTNTNKFDFIVEKIKRFENNDDTIKTSIIESILDAKKIYKLVLSYSVEIDDGSQKIDLLNSISRDFSYYISGDNFIEIMPKNVSKGSAIRFLKDFYNINRDELIILGDSGNDVSMFSQSIFSATRSCAKDFVKNLVTKSFDGGPSVFIKEAINYFLEIKK